MNVSVVGGGRGRCPRPRDKQIPGWALRQRHDWPGERKSEETHVSTGDWAGVQEGTGTRSVNTVWAMTGDFYYILHLMGSHWKNLARNDNGLIDFTKTIWLLWGEQTLGVKVEAEK